MAQTTNFTSFANEHPNYFPGQYLLEDDFELQHKYLSDRQRYHNQILHISGIIEGLEVEASSDKKSVQIKSGTAIDGNGELIVLKNDTSFDLKNVPNGDGELYIKFSHEYKKESRQQEGVDASSTRWIEEPIINFAATAPENSIKLLKLIISDNAITNLDLSIRIYSGVSLPNPNNSSLTLRSGGNANPNLAVLTGSLKIDGDFQCSNGAITNILAIGDTPFVKNIGGSREWMKKGIKVSWNTDNLFIGLKEEEGNNRKDAVIAWGDDLDDDLRFIHVPSSGEIEGNEAVRIKANGNVGIGTNKPGEYKLNVQGNQYIKGSLTIEKGKFSLDGNQQIVFTSTDTTDQLKLQLWEGYGLGINPSTLFYTANGRHSWRDHQNNEKMSLTTGKVGQLAINGGLTINGAAQLGYESTISDFGIPLMSGFYQNDKNDKNDIKDKITPPDQSHTWAHLITARHSETKNNHQLQIAASYTNNDRLFFRKIQAGTSVTSNPGWNEVATRGTNTFDGIQSINGHIFEKLDVIKCGGRGDWGDATHPIKVYFKDKLAGKPVGTMMRAIQDHPSWRGHYWQAWVDADQKIRVIHNHINTDQLAF